MILTNADYDIYNVYLNGVHVCSIVDKSSSFQIGDSRTMFYATNDNGVIVHNEGDVESLLYFNAKKKNE
jgi:hypothetical protein